MFQTKKIGIIDSGVGGISTMLEISKYVSMVADVELEYFADTDNCPYGNKSKQWVVDRVGQIIKQLTGNGCDMIVLACNTATNIGVSNLRQAYCVDIVGTEPAIKLAHKDDKNKKTLVLTTCLTAYQDKFLDLVQSCYSKEVANNIYCDEVNNQQLIILPQQDLAMIIQNSAFATEIYDKVVVNKQYNVYDYQMHDKKVELALYDIMDKCLVQYNNIDSIVLGCTHYVFCKDIMYEYFYKQGIKIKIYDGNNGVARRVLSLIKA